MQVILGNGQVGKLIKQSLYIECEDDIEIFDKGEWECLDGMKCSVLHVCFPYFEGFVKTVENARKVFLPKIIIVHSTIKPGIIDLVSKGDILYSPVVGRHEKDFFKSAGNFEKFFAGPKDLYDSVHLNFKFLTRYWGANIESLEYAKVMSTTYMYFNLIYEKVINKDCKEKGYDFDLVYKLWNENYNKGYSSSNEWEFTRPVYKHSEEILPGGHCLRPNIHLIDNLITDFIKQWENSILDNK